MKLPNPEGLRSHSLFKSLTAEQAYAVFDLIMTGESTPVTKRDDALPHRDAALRFRQQPAIGIDGVTFAGIHVGGAPQHDAIAMSFL